jgi:hypothetical protein
MVGCSEVVKDVPAVVVKPVGVPGVSGVSVGQTSDDSSDPLGQST